MPAATERAHGLDAFRATTPRPATELTGLALEPPEQNLFTGGMQPTLSFACETREWTLGTAAWITEITLDALRAAGTAKPCPLTVSREAE
ncbi:hypothetical protein [Streptomyces sp. HNM0574]|uniref:hypothetical protein n=1 Tax=Streptomyces sp. HNM0574 TaxID=2714954 RepID=UPI00146D5609|nr:hypothetical protein [Streptomyces sp. HNM0574]NLU68911.1 hypothetical protein [Streptomyces sp. HNM0574]